MKYPKQQFDQLVGHLKELGNYFDLTNQNLYSLHYAVFQQGNLSLNHNWIYILPSGEIHRKHALSEEQLATAKKLFEVDPGFECYPEGCSDIHVLTATKAAMKLI